MWDSRPLLGTQTDLAMAYYRRSPLNVFFSAVLALAASALILLAGFATYTWWHVPEQNRNDHPRVISGSELQAVVGSSENRGDALAITGYQASGGAHHAVAVWRGRLRAGDYPLLSYDITTGHPRPDLKFVWRTATDPGSVHSTDLNRTDGETPVLNLARQPEWRGTVVEIGVYAISPVPGNALSISRLTFEPYGWRGALAGHWADWTAFRGWSQRSINFLYGAPYRKSLSPVPVAAAWCALAVVLLVMAGWFARSWNFAAMAVALLVPWVCLDLLWQHQLTIQLAQTRDLFAGKSVREKHLADMDSPVYRYVERLKESVLPAEPARIVVLHKSEGHNYERLKVQYYLLPHNVYNLGRSPPGAGLDGVDYVLVLGKVRGVRFNPMTNTLYWRRGMDHHPVALVDSDPMGSLYRVLPVRVGGR